MKAVTKRFRQKNRQRAIPVTDVAIEKVPRTHIFGFCEEQNAHIQLLHKLLLQRVQQLNRVNNTNEMEVGILVDIHSWEHWIIEGKRPRIVDMKNNLQAYQKLITAHKNQLMVMHNHPSTGTFSGEDFRTFCNNDSLYMMSVVGNDSSVYLLIKKNDFDAEKALLEYGRLSMKYYHDGYTRNNGTLAIKTLLKQSDNFGFLYKKGRKGI